MPVLANQYPQSRKKNQVLVLTYITVTCSCTLKLDTCSILGAGIIKALFYPVALLGKWILSLLLSVGLYVCPSVRKLYLVFRITYHRFELDHRIFTKHASCDSLSWYWKWGSLTLTFKVILVIWLSIPGNSGFLYDNSSQICAGITKFAPNIHPGILSAGICNGGHWPWSSRSFWPLWLKSLGNLACPRDKLYWIWAKINKFAPNMHLGILSAGIESKWGSLSLAIWNCKKRRSTSFLYTDLGRPRGVTRPKRALVLFHPEFPIL